VAVCGGRARRLSDSGVPQPRPRRVVVHTSFHNAGWSHRRLDNVVETIGLTDEHLAQPNHSSERRDCVSVSCRTPLARRR